MKTRGLWINRRSERLFQTRHIRQQANCSARALPTSRQGAARGLKKALPHLEVRIWSKILQYFAYCSDLLAIPQTVVYLKTIEFARRKERADNDIHQTPHHHHHRYGDNSPKHDFGRFSSGLRVITGTDVAEDANHNKKDGEGDHHSSECL